MGVSVAVLLLFEKVVMLAITDVRPAHNYVVTMLIICTKVQEKKKKIQKKPLSKESNGKNLHPQKNRYEANILNTGVSLPK